MRRTRFTIFSVVVIVAAMLGGGMQVEAKAKVKKAKAKTTAKTKAPQVIMTGEIAKKVIGYNGTTPVSISISNGRIASITALDNKETPAYFNKAKEKVFGQFVGKTVDEALKLDADAATGATYSSDALIKNIKMGLQQAKGDKAEKADKKSPAKKAEKASKKSTAKSKGKLRMTK